MSSPEKVRIAFIGLKGINEWHYLPGIKAVPGAELVAGVDPLDKARLTFSEKSKCPAYSSLAELLQHHKIDAVFIGTPNQFHLPNIREAAAAGLHLAVTKPLCNTIAECREAIEIARKANVILQVNHEYRYRPSIATGIELVRRGDIGDVTLITAHMGSDGGIAAGNAGTWRADSRNVPGGCLNLNGVHMFDCANAILGQPKEISAIVRCVKSPYGIEDTGAVMVNYDKGVANITVSYASAHRDSVVFHGTTANLVLTDKTVHRMVKRESTPVELLSTESSASILIKEFCDAIHGIKPTTFTGEAGLLLVAMTEASLVSSARKQAVNLEEILKGASQ